MVILVISGFFFIFGLMSEETKIYYPEANLNDSAWAGKYDYVDSINESIAPLQNSFNKIQDENVGWFSKLTSGIAAIPAAVIAIPTLLFGSFITGGAVITGTFTTLKIHIYFIVLVCVMIVVWGIFKLIEMYNRWQV
jgi:hypothetical protein